MLIHFLVLREAWGFLLVTALGRCCGHAGVPNDHVYQCGGFAGAMRGTHSVHKDVPAFVHATMMVTIITPNIFRVERTS